MICVLGAEICIRYGGGGEKIFFSSSSMNMITRETFDIYITFFLALYHLTFMHRQREASWRLSFVFTYSPHPPINLHTFLL